MTVKIEREAILCVINNNNTTQTKQQRKSSSHRKPIRDYYDDDDSYNPSCWRKPKSSKSGRSPSSSLPSGTHHISNKKRFFDETPELDETDDDSTVSSCSSTIKGISFARVTFAEPLVTKVYYRPKTLRRHVRSLYYSVEQTSRFRQEYREERRLKSQEEAECGSLSSASEDKGESSSNSTDRDHSTGDGSATTTNTNPMEIFKHRISRVVVSHKDYQVTFIDKEIDHTTTNLITKLHPGKCKKASDDFFDNDRFWSGQVTWY
jgi:hypothetical protein